ncbi:conserved hypothetical protein [Burkholderia vietnamiensis]|nr:conserved hypothetical protein [Burkholderia vietnamiensis]
MRVILPPSGGFFVYGDSRQDHEKTILEWTIIGALIGVWCREGAGRQHAARFGWLCGRAVLRPEGD